MTYSPKLRIAHIVDAAAEVFGVTVGEIMGPRKPAHVAAARQVAWYVIRTETVFSYPEIGSRFRRDHTTVLHGVARVKAVVDGGVPAGAITADRVRDVLETARRNASSMSVVATFSAGLDGKVREGAA